MKRSLPTKKFPHANRIELEVYYDLGGHNYFTGAEESPGYYLSLLPFQEENGRSIYTTFSGMKLLLEGTKRKSGRRLAELWAAIEPKAKAMARAFEEEDYGRVAQLARQTDDETASAEEAEHE